MLAKGELGDEGTSLYHYIRETYLLFHSKKSLWCKLLLSLEALMWLTTSSFTSHIWWQPLVPSVTTKLASWKLPVFIVTWYSYISFAPTQQHEKIHQITFIHDMRYIAHLHFSRQFSSKHMILKGSHRQFCWIKQFKWNNVQMHFISLINVQSNIWFITM